MNIPSVCESIGKIRISSLPPTGFVTRGWESVPNAQTARIPPSFLPRSNNHGAHEDMLPRLRQPAPLFPHQLLDIETLCTHFFEQRLAAVSWKIERATYPHVICRSGVTASLYFLLANLASHIYVMDFDSLFIVCPVCRSSAIWHLYMTCECRAIMRIKARFILA